MDLNKPGRASKCFPSGRALEGGGLQVLNDIKTLQGRGLRVYVAESCLTTVSV